MSPKYIFTTDISKKRLSKNKTSFKLTTLLCALLSCSWAHAQGVDASQTAQQIEQRQREQQEQQRAQQQQEQEERARTNTPVQPIPVAPVPPASAEPSVCFRVHQIDWRNARGTVQPPWYLKRLANSVIRLNPSEPDGRSLLPKGITDKAAANCLTQSDIVALQKRLSNALIEQGHITSKIDFPEQNIASGTLLIEWYPGTVGKITHDTAGGKPIGSLSMLFPNREGQLYNQRQADQALENLKRLSSQGNASLDLRPGEVAGTSDIVYKIEATPFIKRVNGSIGIDNAGSESTGEHQLNGSISIDSPLHINDQFTLNFNHNADVDRSQHNTRTLGAYWDVATGYATFGLGYNKNTYLQTVAGFVSDLSYEGDSEDFYASAGAMLHRNSNSKTQASFKLGRKISHNYIDDTEVTVQMRDYVYTDTGLSHTRYHKDQQYTVSLNLRQSLPNQSKATGFIYGEPEWDGKWRVYTLNANASVPFKIQNSSWKYSGTVKVQHARRPTPGSELFSLGSRYTVRGFDESFSISGEDGLLLRNELAYLYGANKRQQVYLGLDWGKIKGPSTESAIATTLAGAAIGVKGSYKRMNYDLSVGIPLNSPDYYKGKNDLAFYGSLSYQF
jgi:hemolysin activation/secretion protein